jgi:hypothetical protein
MFSREDKIELLRRLITGGLALMPENPDPHTVAIKTAEGIRQAHEIEPRSVSGFADLPAQLVAGEFDQDIAGILGYC